MKFGKYIEKTRKTWDKKDSVVDNVNHAMLGLVEESGEIAKPYKENIASNIPLDIDLVKENIGNLCYYISRLIDELDFGEKEQLYKRIDNITEGKTKYEGEPSEIDLALSISHRIGGVYAALITNKGPVTAKAVVDLLFNVRIMTEILEVELTDILKNNVRDIK